MPLRHHMTTALPVCLLLVLGLCATLRADVAPGPINPRPPTPPQPPPIALSRHFVVTGIDKIEGTTFILALYRGGEFKAAKVISNDVPFEGFTREQERHGEGTPTWKLHAVFTTELPEAITGAWIDGSEKLTRSLHQEFKSYRFAKVTNGAVRERVSYKVSIVTEENAKYVKLERTKLEQYDGAGKVVLTEEGAGGDGDEDGIVDGDEPVRADETGRRNGGDGGNGPEMPVWLLMALAMIGLTAVLMVAARRG
ncbi:MAG: hypothetical protein AB7S36_05275 [Planctomycetota bacterium]